MELDELMTGICLVLAVAAPAASCQQSRTWVFVVAGVTQWGLSNLRIGEYLSQQPVGVSGAPNMRAAQLWSAVNGRWGLLTEDDVWRYNGNLSLALFGEGIACPAECFALKVHLMVLTVWCELFFCGFDQR